MDELPSTFATTRAALQRVAVHIIARRRHALVGKIGLRATPGGIGAPAAGPDHEVLRTSGAWLLRERTGLVARTTSLDLRTASLATAAAFASVDLGGPFTVGHDTPSLGDVDAPLGLDPGAAAALSTWFAFGATAIDAVVAALDPAAEPTVVQVWPEHFDAGCDVAAAPDQRVNLGASAGDGFHAEPYVYLGPWEDSRPGDAAYWNAPFGAVLGYEGLRRAADPMADAVAFLRRGLELVRSAAR